MESHPFLWLELRQIRRTPLLFYPTIVLGVLMGFHTLIRCFGWGDDFGSPLLYAPRFSLFLPRFTTQSLFFLFSSMVIPYSLGRKFVEQRMNDDSLFHTPLSPFAILCDKIAAGAFLLGCLYALPLVVAFLGLLIGFPTRSYAFFNLLASYFGSLCTLAIVLGFMTGAKTTTKTVVLVFLCLGCLLAISSAAYILPHSIYYVPAAGYTARRFSFPFATFQLIMLFLVNLLAALCGLWTGIMTFSPKKFKGSGRLIIGLLVLATPLGAFLAYCLFPGFIVGSFFFAPTLIPGLYLFVTMPICAVAVSRWGRDG